jgi:hypothetical protein
MMPDKPKTPALRTGDHRLLTRLAPAEERALRRIYPETGVRPPAVRPKQRKKKGR